MRLFLLSVSVLQTACVATTREDAITAALVGRAVDYSYEWDGPMAERDVQHWTADGRTWIDNHYDVVTRDISGHWKVENGRYCEIFGNNPTWTCLRVTFLEGGLVQFKEYPSDFGELFIPLFNEDRTGKFLPD